MPFEMRCNMCGVALRLDESQFGSIFNCPSCGQVIFVQALPQSPTVTDFQHPTENPLALSAPQQPPASDLPDFLRPADEPRVQPPKLDELIPQPLPSFAPPPAPALDLGSSLSEMFAGEEQSSSISLGQNPPALEPQPTVRMPWEQPASAAPASPTPPQRPVQAVPPCAPVIPPQAPPPAAPELPWLAQQAATTSAFDATTPFGPSQIEAPTSPFVAQAESPFNPFALQSVAAPQPTPAQPVPQAPQFVPAPIPPAKSDVPEFFLPTVTDEPSRSVAPAASATSYTTLHALPASVKQKSRIPLLVGVYVSGVILGLILGKFIFGKPTPTGLELIRDDGANREKTQWIAQTSAVPRDQLKKIGETIQLGHLAVTAMGVEKKKVSLERTDPFTSAKEKTTSPEECLILRVRLKNTSRDVEFAPLDETFLRSHLPKKRPTYSFIETEGGKPIRMYELAEFSEWNIVGQPFDTIKPGGELEAIIPAESGSPAKAKGSMVWRIQVRAGGPKDKSYSTVVAFEFTPEQIRG